MDEKKKKKKKEKYFDTESLVGFCIDKNSS